MNVVVIMSGHGEFSQGLQSLIKGVLGDVDNLYVVPYAYDMSSAVFRDQLECLVTSQEPNSTFLILTDMKGGTPFNKSVELKLMGYDIEVLTGTNFNMVVAAVEARNDVDTMSELVEIVLEQGKESISAFVIEDTQISFEEEDDGI